MLSPQDTRFAGTDDAAWFTLALEYPRFSIQPVQIELMRALRDSIQGEDTHHARNMAFVTERLEDAAVLTAVSGVLAFDAVAQRTLESFTRPSELRWIPLRLVTPDGVREDFAVAAPVHGSCDVISEADTTFDGRGRPWYWFLDPAKVADRDVVLVPDTTSNFLAMRGRVVQALVDAGAQGLKPERARVAPSKARGRRRD